MTGAFLGQNLRLARLFNELSLQELAVKVDKSKQFLSRLESGLEVPNDLLEISLADALSVLPQFFREIDPMPISDEQCHFRKQLTTKLAFKQVARAKGEMFKRLVSILDQNLDFPQYGFLHEEVLTLEDIERVAERSRSHWSLGLGPIANMSRVAENAGAVLIKSDGLSNEIDAISFATRRPVIALNAMGKSACRTRFGIAHEIGHLTFHIGVQTGDRTTEQQANRFASAFLMPRAYFIKECQSALRGSRLSWQVLSDIKIRWGVSKAAILYRGRQLGVFSENQYRSGVISLKRRGEAIQEHEDRDMIQENPEVILDSMKMLAQQCGISRKMIADSIFVKPVILDKMLSSKAAESIQSNNIVNLQFLRPTTKTL